LVFDLSQYSESSSGGKTDKLEPFQKVVQEFLNEDARKCKFIKPVDVFLDTSPSAKNFDEVVRFWKNQMGYPTGIALSLGAQTNSAWEALTKSMCENNDYKKKMGSLCS